MNPPVPISAIASSTRRTRASFISDSYFHISLCCALFPVAIVTRRTLTAELLAKLSSQLFPHLKGRFFPKLANLFPLYNILLCIQLCFNLVILPPLSWGHCELKTKQISTSFTLSLSTIYLSVFLTAPPAEGNPTMSCPLIRERIGAVWR